MKYTLLGCTIDALSDDELARKLDNFRQTSGHQIVTLNPEILMETTANERLRTAINQAALVVPDGVGVMLMARLTGVDPGRRVTGNDLLERLARESVERKERVYLFGGEPGVARSAALTLRRKYPNIRIVGADAELRFWGMRLPDSIVVGRIRRAKPDLLFVALGAPKQELWLAKHLRFLPSVKLGVGVGGAFDFLAGRVRRAPVLVRWLGFEWLWRVALQPWRFQRILTATVRFPFAVFRSKLP